MSKELERLDDNKKITVCSKCFQSTCYQGYFMCDEAQQASTLKKTIRELKKLNLESPYYWTDEFIENGLRRI